MNEGNGSGSGALFNATAAKPAFLRIKDNRRFLLLRIGHQHVSRTYLRAEITSVALIGIKLDSPIG